MAVRDGLSRRTRVVGIAVIALLFVVVATAVAVSRRTLDDDGPTRNWTGKVVSVGSKATCVVGFDERDAFKGDGLPTCVDSWHVEGGDRISGLRVGECVLLAVKHPAVVIVDRGGCPDRPPLALRPPLASRQLAAAFDAVGVPNGLTLRYEVPGDVADCEYCTRLTRWYCAPAESQQMYRSFADYYRRAGLNVNDDYMKYGDPPIVRGKDFALSIDPIGRPYPPRVDLAAGGTVPETQACPDPAAPHLLQLELQP